jgi:SAM-dependent methyltransferase
MVNVDSYEHDYRFPYHWVLDELSLWAIQYLGYVGLVGGMVPAKGAISVLDMGCGDGRISAELVKRGFRVTGVDVSRNAIAHARNLVPDGTFLPMDVLELHRHGDLHGRFDAVIAVELIEHLPPREHGQLVRMAHLALRSDGILIASVPSLKMPLRNPQHYKHFALGEFVQLVENGGLFQVEEVIGNHHVWFLGVSKVYPLLCNRYYDLRFARRVLRWLYRRHVMVAPLASACRYIAKARKRG